MDNVIVVKSKKFALHIIRLYKYLINNKHEFVIGNQILKSGTSIGANIKEAVCSMSKREFIAKLNISLKEASETEYWLELLYESSYISREEFTVLYDECKELLRLLTAIIKTSNKNKSPE